MSQRPPKRRSRKKGQQRRARGQDQAPSPQMQSGAAAAGAAPQQSSREADPSPKATRSTRAAEQRSARRAEAEKKARQRKQLQILGGVVAAAVVIAIVLVLANRPSSSGLDTDYEGLAFAPPPITATAGTPVATPGDETSDDPYVGARLGNPDAPVTMVIYADFQCPYCRIFAADTQQKIIDDFVRPGTVRLEFREMPILGGPDLASKDNESSMASQAALCAAEQSDYLGFHDKLFGNQQGENRGNFSEKRLKQFAKELGLDTDAFGTCLDSGRYIPALEQSKAEGQAQGISATPMFIIENGNESSGPIQMTDQGYDLLKKQLEAAIETAK